MPGIHVPEAPGFSGWTRLRDGGWKTMNPSEIEQMKAAIKADIEACGCSPINIVRHSTGHVSDRSAMTYHCRSLSRWFNPKTRKMEGSAHCTCDGCL